MRQYTLLSSSSFSGLLLLFAAGVRAEAPAVASPFQDNNWAQEAEEPEETESPELKALRLAEEELFSQREPEDPRQAKAAPAVVFEEPPAHIELNGKRVDLGFLKGLAAPGLPVRWDRRVIEYLLFFKDDPRGRELAAGWLKRRERFGTMIRRVLEEHGLPADVQYVAMIESGYDPTARSQVDAWGMWQFMKSPGSSYGLRIDRWVDERLDPERSTRAAARFVRDLHDRFGSWDLAFAAYNMGYGGVLKAIKKYNSNDYWLLSHLEAGLPFETSLYVAKITAMTIIAHNPQHFGFGELTMERQRSVAKVDVAPGTELDDIASAAGITVEQLRVYNPHLKQARTPPGDDIQIYVPRDQLVQFTQKWAARRNAPSVQTYTVRLGESLDEVAKRSDTSVETLRELNQLAADEKVKPGFTMLVPGNAGPSKEVTEQLVATVPDREFSYEDRKHVFYRVGAEDDSTKVAQFFDVTHDELLSWNNLGTNASLQPGMLLQLFVKPEVDLNQAVIYEPKDVKTLTLGSDEFFAYHEAQRGRVRVRYRVQQGDTLTSLGKRFEMSPGSLGRINQFASDRELRAGDTMILYVPKKDVAAMTSRGQLAPLHEDEPAPALATNLAAPVEHATEDSWSKPKAEAVSPARRPVAPPTTWATEPMAPEEEEEKPAPKASASKVAAKPSAPKVSAPKLAAKPNAPKQASAVKQGSSSSKSKK